MATHVLVDIGNQRTKWTWFSPGHDDPLQLIPQPALIEPEELQDFPDHPLNWIVCSVNRTRCHRWQSWVNGQRPQDRWRLVDYRDIPLNLCVESPERVGTDRLLACFAARQRCGPGEPLVVIDSGTAVTIDVLSVNDEFLGGVIFPGIATSLKSLQQNTDALPALNFDRFPEFVIGNSTARAIHAGVYQAQVGGIRHIVDQIQATMGPHRVLVSGGGMAELLQQLPANWEPTDDLVLQGLAHLSRSLADHGE